MLANLLVKVNIKAELGSAFFIAIVWRNDYVYWVGYFYCGDCLRDHP